ncbi:recombinase family protein [Microcoleus sp. FACHB-831]|uniref:fdxN element excision recombinase XisF n=1 Tax=Microcoleus sp. FACHB-831 TaxID=2692827 RepID=UPI0016878BCA|nr:fdxN element excision recombinase XisF [Microcoleus sp. FACHB-831]MBD1919790.1 recombinase family protein [Microcoleus sp. FACHB-831]
MGQIVGYERVSSNEQAINQNALKQQDHRIQEYGVDMVIQDIESGADPDREGFNHLLDLVSQGKVDEIVSTRWDRLTRNELVYLQFKAILKASNVKLTLLDQGEVDLSTAFGELSADMQAMFAVHERRMLKERVQRGCEYRRFNKVAWTRAPWGYGIKNDKYVLDTEPIICILEDRPQNFLELYDEPDTSPLLLSISKSQIAREAVDVFLQTRRTRKVLRYLYLKYGVERKKGTGETGNGQEGDKKRTKGTNLVLSKELLFWSAGGNLKEWLENPVLRGHTAYKKYKKRGSKKDPKDWEMHYDTHPDQRLISDEEFQEIQEILKSNARQIGTPGKTFYLTGLVICERCGHKCVLKRNADYQYYGCRNSTIGCSNRKCIRIEKIDEAIINQLFNRANEIALAPDGLQEEALETSELSILKQQLQELEKILEMNPTHILKKTQYDLQKEIESQSNQANNDNFVQATAMQLIRRPEARKKTFWYTLTLEERDIIYDKLVRKIAILDGEVVSVDLTI